MKKNKKTEVAFNDPPPFTVKSYWLDYQAHPNHPTVTPQLVLSSTDKRTDTPAAIVHFHYSPDFTETSASDAHNVNLFTLHYHISMLEVILKLLKSNQPLKCYMKKELGDWGGIRLEKEISI